MNLLMSLYLAALFVAFTPGVLVSLPPKGGKYVVLVVHSLLFVLVWHFTHRIVWRMSIEGFQNNYNNSGNNGVVNNTGNNGVVNNGVVNNGMNANGMNANGNNGLVNNGNNGMNANGMNANGMNVNGNVEGFGCPQWQRMLGFC